MTEGQTFWFSEQISNNMAMYLKPKKNVTSGMFNIAQTCTYDRMLQNWSNFERTLGFLFHGINVTYQMKGKYDYCTWRKYIFDQLHMDLECFGLYPVNIQNIVYIMRFARTCFVYAVFRLWVQTSWYSW